MNKNNTLCLFYVSKTDIDKQALKKFMSDTLSEFMMPQVFVRLEKMPTTPNGKINKKALPDPKIDLGEIVAPESDAEKAIFDVATELLGNSDFGVTTGFISLGMNSIVMMRLAATLEQKLNIRVLVSDIMKNPTVRAIAELSSKNTESILWIKTIIFCREALRESYALQDLK